MDTIANELVKVAKEVVGGSKYKDLRQIPIDIEAMMDAADDAIDAEKEAMEEGRVNRWQGSSNISALTNLRNALRETYLTASSAVHLVV